MKINAALKLALMTLEEIITYAKHLICLPSNELKKKCVNKLMIIEVQLYPLFNILLFNFYKFV